MNEKNEVVVTKESKNLNRINAIIDCIIYISKENAKLIELLKPLVIEVASIVESMKNHNEVIKEK